MAQESGWSSQMDRKLTEARKDPSAYFANARKSLTASGAPQKIVIRGNAGHDGRGNKNSR